MLLVRPVTIGASECYTNNMEIVGRAQHVQRQLSIRLNCRYCCSSRYYCTGWPTILVNTQNHVIFNLATNFRCGSPETLRAGIVREHAKVLRGVTTEVPITVCTSVAVVVIVHSKLLSKPK